MISWLRASAEGGAVYPSRRSNAAACLVDGARPGLPLEASLFCAGLAATKGRLCGMTVDEANRRLCWLRTVHAAYTGMEHPGLPLPGPQASWQTLQAEFAQLRRSLPWYTRLTVRGLAWARLDGLIRRLAAADPAKDEGQLMKWLVRIVGLLYPLLTDTADLGRFDASTAGGRLGFICLAALEKAALRAWHH